MPSTKLIKLSSKRGFSTSVILKTDEPTTETSSNTCSSTGSNNIGTKTSTEANLTREQKINNSYEHLDYLKLKKKVYDKEQPQNIESLESSRSELKADIRRIKDTISSRTLSHEEQLTVDNIEARNEWRIKSLEVRHNADRERVLSSEARYLASIVENMPGMKEASKNLKKFAEDFDNKVKKVESQESQKASNEEFEHEVNTFLTSIQGHDPNRRETKKSSLIDDFADVSTEMPSYIDPED